MPDPAAHALASRTLAAARGAHLTLGCAESCTGGLVAAALTDVAGSSDTFVGGIVSYWPDVKRGVLGVSEETIHEHGVVSEQCAAAMASGARRMLGCDVAIATTGIAGPGGAEPGKPVGTVCFAIALPGETTTFTTCRGSTRQEVRELAVAAALEACADLVERRR